MICLTRLNGTEIYLNPELILSVEEKPDTVLTMTNGEKFIIKENAREVVDRFMAYKRGIAMRTELSAS